MGLFDFFKKSDTKPGESKELARLQKMVSNKLSQNVDREDALYRLGELATPEAARVLLSRFNWTLNPSIKDQEEKELAVRGIASTGEKALEVIRSYCSRSETITWPLKALRKIVTEDKLENELLGILDEFDTEYMRNPEPKIQLLQILGEFTSDDVRVAVQPFLTDTSELVRFAAVTTVLGCNHESAVESLATAMVAEESLRVKNRVAIGIVERGWLIPSSIIDSVKEACPPGFNLDKSGLLSGKPNG